MLSYLLTNSGSTALWTLVGIAVTSFFTALGIWFKYGPARMKAKNEEKVIDQSGMEKVIINNTAQLKDFRDEVHKYRNEMQVLQGELWASNRVSNQRSDRIDTLETIIELLLSEIERLDPNSIVVRQAKIMLRRVVAEQGKSSALNTAEHAVADAKQTVVSATATCDEVRATESGK